MDKRVESAARTVYHHPNNTTADAAPKFLGAGQRLPWSEQCH
jgi:hypothetical protein